MGKFSDFFYIFKKNKAALLGLVLLFLLFFSALFAPLLAPFSPIEQDLERRFLPPLLGFSGEGRWPHLLGTDDFGRDLWSRLLYGSQISIVIGLISVGISLVLGVILGCFAGYYGGKVDAWIMGGINILLALPAMLLAIVIVALLGPGLVNAMIAIGIVNIPVYTRLVRASVLQERQKEYVTASRLSGSSSLRLMFVVIFPNCVGPLIIQSTMGFASAILEAAGLSFLALGAQAPTPEWGAMLADSMQFIRSAPWMIFFPGMAIFFTVLGFNLVGDGLMDIFDPKSKEK